MAIPSGYTPLDFVGFTDKGTYANNVPYVKNDLVHYGGDIWKCKVDNTTGVTPVDGVNWEIFIGEPTNLVERIIAPLETNPATIAYTIGRQIIYDDWLWEVIAPIAIGDILVDYAVDPSNANIKKAPAVETQLLSLSSKAYQTDDSTETDIADDDLLPFYDTSATTRKKSTWSNIIAKIKAKLGTAATKDFTTSVTSGSANLVTSGGVYTSEQTIKQALTNEAVTRSKVGAHNLLPMKLDFIKDNNITGTWSDNVYSIDNVVVTFYADALGNVQRIHFVITAPTTEFIPILISHKDFGNTEISSYTGGGTPDRANGYIISDGLGTSISSPRLVYKASDNSILFRVDEGTSAVEYDIYPMVRRETDENTIFEPYALPNSEIPFQIVRGTKTISSSGQEVTFGFGNNVYFYDIPTVVVCFNESRQKVLANVGSNNISVVDITRTGFTVHIDRVANTDALKIQYIATTLGVVDN